MTTAALKPKPERLALLPEIELDSGGHPAPPKDCTHPEGCDREIAAWVLGQEWTDRAPWESPVLAAFRRRLNDALPVDLRQHLKDSMFDGLGTVGDGRDEDRAWMITDWSIRVALPTWLEVAGVEEAPKTLRALPEVTAETFGEVKPLVYRLRDEAWERRKAAKKQFREKVEAELKKRGIPKDAAADAVAAAVATAAATAVADAVAAAAAVAAADADAVAAAVAVAAADAVAAAAAVADADVAAVAAAAAAAAADAVAAAAAAAVAVAAADAVADAAAAAVADADVAAVAVAVAVADADWRPGVYRAVYQKVKPIYQEKIGEQYRPTQTELLSSALGLLKRMSSLEPSPTEGKEG